MELDTRYVNLVIKDGILIGTYKKGLDINLEVAKEIVRIRILFTEGKKMPAMIKSEGIISMTKPARQFLASDEAITGLSASAIIVNSGFSRFLGNFFVQVNKTKLPVKIFSDVGRAEKWLHQFLV